MVIFQYSIICNELLLRLPDSNKYIKPYYIIFAGIYPSLMIFIGIQVKRFFVIKKEVQIEE